MYIGLLFNFKVIQVVAPHLLYDIYLLIVKVIQ